VEKLVGMLETGSGLITSVLITLGGDTAEQQEASMMHGIGRVLNRELGGRERA
jgi:hypothetical protein